MYGKGGEEDVDRGGCDSWDMREERDSMLGHWCFRNTEECNGSEKEHCTKKKKEDTQRKIEQFAEGGRRE